MGFKTRFKKYRVYLKQILKRDQSHYVSEVIHKKTSKWIDQKRLWPENHQHSDFWALKIIVWMSWLGFVMPKNRRQKRKESPGLTLTGRGLCQRIQKKKF